MRILVVSNLYPPYVIGGYELGCRDIVESLRRRGHEILVLTSTYGVRNPIAEPGVQRVLRLDWGAARYNPLPYLWEIANRRVFRATLRSYKPELVYFWNQNWLPGTLVKLAFQAGLPYVFYVSDGSLRHWRTDSLWTWWTYPPPNPVRAVIKMAGEKLLRAFSIIDDKDQFYFHHHRQFTSKFIQTLSGHSSDLLSDRVIPWGVDPHVFSLGTPTELPPVRLLYVGQVVPEKGVQTAIQAVRLLRDRFHIADTVLTVAGGTVAPGFVAQLQQFVRTNQMENNVIFLGMVNRTELPAIYHKHDILIFPSEQEEPFAITPLEAMASGLVVVGTTTGGSKEIFENGTTAMVFAAKDAEGCAEAIHTLIRDSTLYRAIRERSRRLIEERYTLDGMVHRIEQHLVETMSERTRQAAGKPTGAGQ